MSLPTLRDARGVTLVELLCALVVVSVGAGGVALWQARRVAALRAAAGDVFNTMKSLELDVRRLEA